MLSHAENGKRTILLLEANPEGTSPLRLSEEIRIITDAHARGKGREKFDIKVGTSVDDRHLRRAILDYKPEVVHICGHGSATRGIVFESGTSNGAQLISTAALADTFRLGAKHIVCVVLNFCYSDIQAVQVVKYIPYVIGMNSVISDRASHRFSEGFYDSLFAGEGFGVCYEWGVNAIQSAGIPEHMTPRLKVKEPQLTSSQVLVARYYYLSLEEVPTPLGDTGFSVQRASGQVWQIFDVATNKNLFIEQTIVILRSDKDGFVMPYTSEWVFEETPKGEYTDGIRETIHTVADDKRIRRIGLDGFTLVTPDQELTNRFEAARLHLPRLFPGGDADWHVNEKGQLEKMIDYRNGRPPVVYLYQQLPEK